MHTPFHDHIYRKSNSTAPSQHQGVNLGTRWHTSCVSESKHWPARHARDPGAGHGLPNPSSGCLDLEPPPPLGAARTMHAQEYPPKTIVRTQTCNEHNRANLPRICSSPRKGWLLAKHGRASRSNKCLKLIHQKNHANNWLV